MKKMLFILIILYFVPTLLLAQSTSTVLKKGSGKDTTVFLSLYRGNIPTDKKLEFSVVYNFYIGNDKKYIEKYYTLDPGVQEKLVSCTLWEGGKNPWVNAWATTKLYYELPLFIGRVPVVATADISKK